MSIESDILSTLNTDVALTALVEQRNYSVNLPQKPQYPNTVFMRVTTNPSTTLEGRNNLTNITIQVDARALTLVEARTVATAVRDALEASTLFKTVYRNDNNVPKESATHSYRIAVDFSIWFYEN